VHATEGAVGHDEHVIPGARIGGVPVATVGVGNARNAGLLAVEILSLADETLREKLAAFKGRLVEKVGSKDAALRAALDNKTP